ncbi:MAG: hypothetical protein U1G07_12615 [Verrucomicrobiota bacterium]
MHRFSRRVAVGVGLVALALFLLVPSEPRSQGKTLSAWVAQLDEAEPSRRQEARIAIQQSGRKGRAWMERRLNRPEGRVEKWLGGDHSNGLLTAHDLKRAQLASGLATLGVDATPAVASLQIASTNWHWLIAARAQAALMQIRQESSAVLMQTLSQPTNTGQWIWSASVLRALGTNIAPSVATFLQTSGADLTERFDLIQLLCTNFIEPSISGPLLVSCLKDKEAGVRANTLNALIINRSWDDAARDAIIQCTDDPSPQVRGNAMFALNSFPVEKLRGVPRDMVNKVSAATNDPDPAVRAFAAETVSRIKGSVAQNR